ncbi:MAG: hypothetical protein V1846_03815 [Candidatus Komeilibacteria bacterium]
MFRAISSALSFFLLLVVLKMFAPQLFDLTIQVITQILTLVSHQLDSVGNSSVTTVTF